MTPDPREIFTTAAGRHRRMFWLDGGGAREWSGRRSLIGWLADEDLSLTYNATAREVVRHRGGVREPAGDDIFACLEEEIARDQGDPRVHWVGYFGYACRPDLPAQLHPEPVGRADDRVPDALWMRVRNPLVFEHPSRPEPSGVESPLACSTAGVAVGLEEYRGWFDRVQEQLRLGNSYEVNLTYRQEVRSPVDPAAAYLRLRAINPAPYAGFLQHNGVNVLSSSPERFATVDRHGWVETKPIKGTTPRGATSEDDERHRHNLRTDPRFRAENLMIVDLLRNDLSMVCEPGTVTVPALMEVESYASVHQLVSTVRGHLRPGLSTIESLRALFPAGSMTGAPKLRTMRIIADVETTPRDIYAGALGWISGDGRADLGVVIRTLVATPEASSGWRYLLGTGGGITVHSDAESEYEETRWKAARLLAALT